MTTAHRALTLALFVVPALGCLDPEPPGSDDPSAATPELIPARAWIPVGGSVPLQTVPVGPYSVRVAGGALRLDGSTVTGLAAGDGEVEAFFPRGKSRSTISVVAPIASRRPVVLDAGLTDASLLGVWTADPSTIFAVGSFGTALLSRDGGASWVRMETGTSLDLVSIWGTSATNVYAVGAQGIVLHYDGLRWRRLEVPTSQPLLEVWGLDEDHVYIVGAGAALAFDGVSWRNMPGGQGFELWAVWGTSPTALFASGQNGVLIRWDGSRWLPMASPTEAVLFGLWGSAPDDVYAIGIRGTVLHFDGSEWTRIEVPSSADFFAIWGNRRDNIVVVGNGGSIIAYNGVAWTRVPQLATSENLRAVHFEPGGMIRVAGWAGTVIERGSQGWRRLTGSPTLTAAAWVDDDLYLVGSGGTIRRRRGAVVEAIPPVVRRDLYGIARTAAGELIAVGDTGTILIEQGADWSVSPAPTRALLRSIWASPSDPGVVYIVGDQGVALRRAGAGWERMPTPTTAFLRHVFGLRHDDVYAVGDTGVVIHYDGTRWSRMSSGVSALLRWIAGTGPEDLVAVGEGGLSIRYDGRRWYRIPIGTERELRAVASLSPIEQYAVGQTGLVFRFDGGAWGRVDSLGIGYLLGVAVRADGRVAAVGTNATVVELTR